MGHVLSFLGGLAAWAVGQLGGALAILPKGAQIAIQAVGGLLTLLGIRTAAVSPSAGIQHALDTMGRGWKTLVGCLLAALGYLLSPDVANTLGPKAAGILQVVGTVLAALGLYHATASASK